MMNVNNVKEATINVKVANADSLPHLKTEDIKNISVVITLADNTTETDSCVSMLLAKNVSFFVEGNIITITFDAIIKASKFTYYHYLDESFAFAAIDVESDLDIELSDYAGITYICNEEKEVDELTILKTYEAVDVEEEEYDDDEY